MVEEDTAADEAADMAVEIEEAAGTETEDIRSPNPLVNFQPNFLKLSSSNHNLVPRICDLLITIS